MKIFTSIKGLLLTFIIFTVLFFIVISCVQCNIVTAFSPVVNSIVGNTILNNIKDYKTYETENFIIRYEKKNLDVAKLTGKIAQKHYETVCSMFNYFPKNKVDIIIYDNGDELSKNTGTSSEKPPLGVYYGGMIHVLSPKEWVEDSSNMEIIYETEGPIIHEFAHLIVDCKTRGNYPMWLTEGVALYIEYKITGFEWGKDFTYEDNVSIEELNNNFYGIDQNTAYRKSFEVIRDISNRYGFEKVVMILESLGNGNTIENSTKTILKVNLEYIDNKTKATF